MKTSMISILATALLTVCSAPAMAFTHHSPAVSMQTVYRTMDAGDDHTGEVFVHGYTTKKGHVVQGYWRHKPTHHGGGDTPAPAPAPGGGGDDPAPAPAPAGGGGDTPAPAPAGGGGDAPAPAPAPAAGS